jgi:hypothetical protein
VLLIFNEFFKSFVRTCMLFELLGGFVCGYCSSDTFPDFPQILHSTEPIRRNQTRLTEQVGVVIQLPFWRCLAQFSAEILSALFDMFECFLSFL